MARPLTYLLWLVAECRRVRRRRLARSCVDTRRTTHTRRATRGSTTDADWTWTRRSSRTASATTTSDSTRCALMTESSSAACTSISTTISPRPRPASIVKRPPALKHSQCLVRASFGGGGAGKFPARGKGIPTPTNKLTTSSPNGC